MLSRVAENLYWISRYLERVESVARLLDDSFQLELDAAGLHAAAAGERPVESVLSILGCKEAFLTQHPNGGRAEVLKFLTFERDHADSMLSMIGRARENARGTQETLSAEVWGQINRLYLYLCGRQARRRYRTSPSRFFEGIKRSCILYTGLVESTLPRSEVYHFLQFGRYLERVMQLSRILGVKVHALRQVEPLAAGSLRVVYSTSLLQSCSAYDAYIRQAHEQIDPLGAVGYLMLDPDFPRSMRFGVDRACNALRAISGGDEHGFATEAERLLGRLGSDLRFLDLDEVIHRGLEQFLTEVLTTCHRAAHEVHQTYFLT